MTVIAMNEADDNLKMKELRRPTLCVIDENGIEVTEPEIEDFDEGIRQISLSEPTSPDTADRLSFVQNFLAPVKSNTATINCVENGSLNAITKFSVKDHNANVTSNVTSCENNDLSELKATTARLKLSTRRQSYVTWKDQYLDTKKSVKPIVEDNHVNKTLIGDKVDVRDDGFTEDRKNRINESLEWLRNELLEMRLQDQVLARQLLSLRHEIHKLKLQRSCAEHREMLEDVTMDIEEIHQLQEITDIPLTDSMNDTPLKHLGVTRMHLSARRFSTC